MGLKKDGTVIATGLNFPDRGIFSQRILAFMLGEKLFEKDFISECDVSGWRDITSVAVGAIHTVGLKKGWNSDCGWRE